MMSPISEPRGALGSPFFCLWGILSCGFCLGDEMLWLGCDHAQLGWGIGQEFL